MRILDLFKSHGPKAEKHLELDMAALDTWAVALAHHQGIDKAYADFIESVEREKAVLENALKPFTDENTLTAIPERARTMSALHGHELASQTRKLIATTAFDENDIFGFEKLQDAYFEANSKYKDLTSKNAAALREFFNDELKTVQEILQRIEDAIINFSGNLEQRKYPQIRKAKDLAQRIGQTRERSERYRELLKSLEQDAAHTKEKRLKLEEDIRGQVALIRNEQALTALQRAEKIEQELHEIAARYASIGDDLRNTYKRLPAMRPSPALKHIIDELPKDPLGTITQEHERVTAAFEEAVIQLEDESPGNTKNIITRLTTLAREAESTARKVSTTLPDQRALKRDIMKDIAALQAYDKQQFAMRAKTEEEAIATKVQYLKAELDPAKMDAILLELKALVRDLGATVKGETTAKEAESVDGNEDDGKKNNSKTQKPESADNEKKSEKPTINAEKDADGTAREEDREENDKNNSRKGS